MAARPDAGGPLATITATPASPLSGTSVATFSIATPLRQRHERLRRIRLRGDARRLFARELPLGQSRVASRPAPGTGLYHGRVEPASRHRSGNRWFAATHLPRWRGSSGQAVWGGYSA